MDATTLSALLRLIGPLIQIGCLVLVLRPGVAESTIAGQPVRPLLYLGFLIGFILVVAGLVLSRRRRKPSSREDWDD